MAIYYNGMVFVTETEFLNEISVKLVNNIPSIQVYSDKSNATKDNLGYEYTVAQLPDGESIIRYEYALNVIGETESILKLDPIEYSKIISNTKLRDFKIMQVRMHGPTVAPNRHILDELHDRYRCAFGELEPRVLFLPQRLVMTHPKYFEFYIGDYRDPIDGKQKTGACLVCTHPSKVVSFLTDGTVVREELDNINTK